MSEKTRILIVDDEPVNLDFFELMLGKLGFEVRTAEDGEEALEKITTFNPDLIILDNVMPRLSGWQVTRLLKTDDTYIKHRDTPIIMFSAMDNVKDKVEGFELGIEDYITKPFNFSEVLARIRAVLRGHKLNDQMKRKQKRVELALVMASSVENFIEQVKKSLGRLESAAEGEGNNREGKNGEPGDENLAALVAAETEKIKVLISTLEREMAQLRSEDSNIGDDESSLEDLDSRLREHFINLQENEETMKEVQE
jgi:DNA-binding response OmpR family regulator